MVHQRASLGWDETPDTIDELTQTTLLGDACLESLSAMPPPGSFTHRTGSRT